MVYLDLDTLGFNKVDDVGFNKIAVCSGAVMICLGLDTLCFNDVAVVGFCKEAPSCFDKYAVFFGTATVDCLVAESLDNGIFGKRFKVSGLNLFLNLHKKIELT